MSLLINNLNFSYSKKHVLKDFSMTLEQGQLVYLLGPNGVGKSTLFKCILGQLKGFTGTIKINDQSINHYNIQDLAKAVAYIPQTYMPTFNYTVLDIVTMGRVAYLSIFASPSKDDYKRGKKILDKLHIGHIAHKGIGDISGGERQLVLIARALVQDTHIIIMDEPTANLDYGNQLRIQTLMKQLSKEENKLIILSSHNPQYALQFADYVVAIHKGRSIANGLPEKVIQSSTLKTLYGLDVHIIDGILFPQINLSTKVD